MVGKAAGTLPIFLHRSFYGFNEASKETKIERFGQRPIFIVIHLNSHQTDTHIARTHMNTHTIHIFERNSAIISSYQRQGSPHERTHHRRGSTLIQ